MTYTIQDIQQVLGGHFLNEVIKNKPIERLLFDSRHLVFSTKTLFFAFKSKRQNGHQFIKELYEQGVRNFVITEDIEWEAYPNANFLFVKNSIGALQQLARYHRQQFDIPIIGITGSNGKTIIKEWLFQLLAADYSIVKNPGSYNSQIGVPLSIWSIEAKHQLGIFEAGISTTREMEKLAPIIDCNIGIFTNIGAAHREGFESKKQKVQEKLKLFRQTATIIYCKDHDLIDIALQAQENKKLFTWSFSKTADLQVLSVDKKAPNSTIFLRYQKQSFSFSIPFLDNASIENAIHCCALMLLLGTPTEVIQDRMPYLEPISMRLELKKGINNCTILNDSYSSDLTSLELALNFATKRTSNKALVLILSDILQSGLSAEKLYQQVAELIIEKKVAYLIGIGDVISIITKYLTGNIKTAFYKTTKSFIKAFNGEDFTNQIILLKGARVFEFEKIVYCFEEKIHKAVLEVDLNAIIHNLKIYGSYLNQDTRLIAMVKASAYGSGSIEVAKILEFYKVDYLAVAYADEGVELRKAGIQIPIIVLNPEATSFNAFIQYNLEPEIYSLHLLKQLLQFLKSESKKIAIHLKLDTGMHRLGFEKENVAALLSILQESKNIKVKSIFSHLAASDMGEHDDFTATQIAHFLEMYETIATVLKYRPFRHILNSSGILRFSQYQFEMVRLGIGLYGIDSSGIVQNKLRVVNTLKATISQIKQIQQAETVGYNRSGKIHAAKTIATINIGYADGLSRKAGNERYAVSIKGQSATIIGNVCMDMCMVDITNIPDTKIGDEVIIFGEDPTVHKMANCLETIPYEVFTSISNRVKRIYYRN